MNCPSCGASMQLKPGMDSFKCDYCHAVYFPEKNDDGVRVLGEQTDAETLVCPVCSIPLMQASIANFRITYCTQCRGMLMPMGEFPVLIGELQSQQRATMVQPAVDPTDLRRTIHCPHCQRAMDAHFYAGPGNVTIDSCYTCALNWLDHGELMRIVQAPDQYHPVTFTDTSLAYHDTRIADTSLDDRFFTLSPYEQRDLTYDLVDAIASLFRR